MDLTLYLAFSSLDRGALINFLRMWDGALKWRFLFFLREEEVILLNFILVALQYKPLGHSLTEHLHVVLKLIPNYVFNCILLHWVSGFLQFNSTISISSFRNDQSRTQLTPWLKVSICWIVQNICSYNQSKLNQLFISSLHMVWFLSIIPPILQ